MIAVNLSADVTKLPLPRESVTVCAKRVQLLVAGAQRILQLQRVVVNGKHKHFKHGITERSSQR